MTNDEAKAVVEQYRAGSGWPPGAHARDPCRHTANHCYANIAELLAVIDHQREEIEKLDGWLLTLIETVDHQQKVIERFPPIDDDGLVS